jgi:hypothetical protein
VELWGLVLTALLEASRGRDDAAAAAIAAARGLGFHDAQVEGLLGAAEAHVALNTGDLQAAHRAAVEGLDALARSELQQGISRPSRSPTSGSGSRPTGHSSPVLDATRPTNRTRSSPPAALRRAHSTCGSAPAPRRTGRK